MERQDDIKEEFFFSLLVRMKIITPLNNTQSEAEEYFIPFALSAYNLQQENEILFQYGYPQGEPLLIQFCSGLQLDSHINAYRNTIYLVYLLLM